MSKTTLMKTGHTIQLPEGMTMKQTADNQWEVVPVEKKLPRKWEDLGPLDGYFTNGLSMIGEITEANPSDTSKNTWPTKELAQASLAMSQLMQLYKAWTNGETGSFIARTSRLYAIPPLKFETLGVCKDFEQTFKDLIEQASPLYE